MYSHRQLNKRNLRLKGKPERKLHVTISYLFFSFCFSNPSFFPVLYHAIDLGVLISALP